MWKKIALISLLIHALFFSVIVFFLFTAKAELRAGFRPEISREEIKIVLGKKYDKAREIETDYGWKIFFMDTNWAEGFFLRSKFIKNSKIKDSAILLNFY